jgi:hypothetical protein
MWRENRHAGMLSQARKSDKRLARTAPSWNIAASLR